MNNNEQLNILLYNQESILFEGIKELLSSTYTASIEIHEASLLIEVEEKIYTNSYDLVILDTDILNTNVSNILRLLLKQDDKLKILLLANSNEEIEVLHLVNKGVFGSLDKKVSKTTFLLAVQTVLDGNYFLSNEIAKLLMHNKLKYKSYDGVKNVLSKQEYLVMQYLVKGVTQKDIAKSLKLHSSTVSTHKTRMMKKLNVKNTIELASLAKTFIV